MSEEKDKKQVLADITFNKKSGDITVSYVDENDIQHTYTKTKDVVVKSQEQLKNGIEIYSDEMQRKKVDINIFKGSENTTQNVFNITNTKMLRLKITFIGDLVKYVAVDTIVAKDIVESIDIDFYLIDYFLKTKFKTKQVGHMLTSIYEIYKIKNVGEFLGKITLLYSEYIDLVNFLKYLAYEPFIKDETSII